MSKPFRWFSPSMRSHSRRPLPRAGTGEPPTCMHRRNSARAFVLGRWPRSWLPHPAPARYRLALWTGSFLSRLWPASPSDSEQRGACQLDSPVPDPCQVRPEDGLDGSDGLLLPRVILGLDGGARNTRWRRVLRRRQWGGEPFWSLCSPPRCGRAPGWPPESQESAAPSQGAQRSLTMCSAAS